MKKDFTIIEIRNFLLLRSLLFAYFIIFLYNNLFYNIHLDYIYDSTPMRVISPCCGEVAFGLRYPISKPYQEVLSQLLLSLVGTGKVGGSLLAISKSLQTQKIMSSTQQNINNRYSDCSETAVGSMWCASQRSTRSKCSITTDNAQMNTETEPCNRDTRITELTIGPLVDNTSPSSQLLEDIASAVENALDSDDDSDVDEENDGKHQKCAFTNYKSPFRLRDGNCSEGHSALPRRSHLSRHVEDEYRHRRTG